MNINELQKRFELPGTLSLVEGSGDLPMLWVNTPWSAAEIYLQGAHVATFQKENEPAMLFLSEESQFAAGKPIRGGVPVILPWFGPREGDVAHGFARTTTWELAETKQERDGSVRVVLRLPDCPEMVKWPKPFAAEYTVTVGKTLKLALKIENISKERELVLEDCLHTYFEVGDIGSVKISGLRGVKYLDKMAGGAEKTETNEEITVSSEVDRVYMDTKGTVTIQDAKLGRVIRVEKQGSNSTVVWNPWIAKSKAMADFGDEEYQRMVCVESGNVAKNKLTLKPGEASSLQVTLSSE